MFKAGIIQYSSAVARGFITEWVVSGDAAARTIELPLNSGGSSTFNCTVDWGDGTPTSTITAYNDPDRIHTYASNGTYEVEILGTCEGWSFGFTSASKLKITKIIDWGNISLFDGFKYLYYGFYNCHNLIDICTGGIKVSGVSMAAKGLESVFRYCPGLTSLPSDLLVYNTAYSSNLANSFQGCTALTAIPIDLFRYNISITNFGNTFKDCTALITIPTDLFRYNVAVSTAAFTGTFRGCSLLATVPEYLFKYNVNAGINGFWATFYGCTKLQLNKWIFYASGEESTRFFNRTSNFSYCFERASFSGVQGSAPELWNCNFGTATPTKTSCYAGAGNSATSLDNYASIPAAWK